MASLTRRRFLGSATAAGLALPAAVPLTGRTSKSPLSTDLSPKRPGTRSDPLGVRSLFPVTEELAYLNTASTGPLPVSVRDALSSYAEERSTYRDPGSRRRALNGARERYANLFGADVDEIALLFSTSDGENLIANAIDWRPGDNVVVDELHFVTAFVVYRELEKCQGVELRIVPARENRAQIDDYDAFTDDRTRLISVAWVSNRNGFRQDLPALAEVAHARNAILFADGIQAFGTFPTNLHAEGVDVACGNGYKWLFAEFGVAPLFVRREHMEWLRPDRFGHGTVSETLPGHEYRLYTDARKYEYANPAQASIAALNASLEFIEGVGLANIAEHTHALAARLRAGAETLGMQLFTPPENPSPIVSFYHGLDPERLAQALNEAGVMITFQEDGKLLRAAVAMFNNEEDADRLLEVISALV